eukprot:scaffold136251_cov17-Tisochrysis_lutea.AAC.1
MIKSGGENVHAAEVGFTSFICYHAEHSCHNSSGKRLSVVSEALKMEVVCTWAKVVQGKEERDFENDDENAGGRRQRGMQTKAAWGLTLVENMHGGALGQRAWSRVDRCAAMKTQRQQLCWLSMLTYFNRGTVCCKARTAMMTEEESKQRKGSSIFTKALSGRGGGGGKGGGVAYVTSHTMVEHDQRGNPSGLWQFWRWPCVPALWQIAIYADVYALWHITLYSVVCALGRIILITTGPPAAQAVGFLPYAPQSGLTLRVCAGRRVEAALCQHPGVAAAAVFGVPDARMGEVVAAAVALQPGWDWKGLVLGQEAGRAAARPLQDQGLSSIGEQQQQQQQQQQQHRHHQGLAAGDPAALGTNSTRDQQQQHHYQQQVPAAEDPAALGTSSTKDQQQQEPLGQRALTADQLRAFCRTGTLHGDGSGPKDGTQYSSIQAGAATAAANSSQASPLLCLLQALVRIAHEFLHLQTVALIPAQCVPAMLRCLSQSGCPCALDASGLSLGSCSLLADQPQQ